MTDSMHVPVAAPVEPFFFGPRARQLYGCYHEPPTWPAREIGVVLCYPYGQEMLRSHRACHHLAVQLAQAGFPTLRFDYSGTGDSAGDGADAHLETWLDDLSLAVDALRSRSGAGPVVLAGLRLGATLALLGAPTIAEVAGLLLWEPVCSGGPYLEALRVRHEETINRFFVRPKDYVATAQPSELTGFAMPNALRAQIAQINLQQPQTHGVLTHLPCLLIESHGDPEIATLAATLQTRAALTHLVIPSFTVWVEDVDKGLVPQPLLEAMTAWMEATYP